MAAFTKLAFNCRYGEIRVAAIVAGAGIARSTFYQHFRGKDDVLLATIEPILLPLAGAASGRTSQVHLSGTLAHLWEKRALARIIFDSAGTLVQRHLAGMIATRLDENRFDLADRAFLSRAVAAAQVTVLRMWLAGEQPCAPDHLAARLLEHSRVRGASPLL